jgi:hypothetical protein
MFLADNFRDAGLEGIELFLLKWEKLKDTAL